MERRSFLRKLFGATAAATAVSVVPALAKKKEETFTWEDMAVPHTGNKNLFYIKQDCWLNQEIAKALGDKVVDRKYFKYYLPKRDILIPMKDEYTKEDFTGLLLWAKHGITSFEYFCNGTGDGGIETGLCRFISDEKKGVYILDFFAARNPKQDSFLEEKTIRLV